MLKKNIGFMIIELMVIVVILVIIVMVVISGFGNFIGENWLIIGINLLVLLICFVWVEVIKRGMVVIFSIDGGFVLGWCVYEGNDVGDCIND